jgi:hypothetical protein
MSACDTSVRRFCEVRVRELSHPRPRVLFYQRKSRRDRARECKRAFRVSRFALSARTPRAARRPWAGGRVGARHVHCRRGNSPGAGPRPEYNARRDILDYGAARQRTLVTPTAPGRGQRGPRHAIFSASIRSGPKAQRALAQQARECFDPANGRGRRARGKHETGGTRHTDRQNTAGRAVARATRPHLIRVTVTSGSP